LPGLTIPFYNLNFSNESVSGNWLNGFPNSLQGFFNAFNPTLTPFDVDILPSPIQQWEIVNTTATSFSEYNGVFPSFNNEVIDNGNNFSGQSYIVPFSGVYTFNVSFLCTKRTSVAGNYTVIAIINRLDGSSTIQQQVLGTPVTGAGLLQPTATATFYCNQGDVITTDVTGASTVGNLFISIEVPPGIPGFTISRFYGSGSNFQSPDLQPVDINDVQAYLYKFKRPLSMAEINAIASETSKPILLGRKDDALAVSPTYIKNIQIESVMRKGAQFELRSNKLLP
jgi:hypothetical protein